ncbi:MAG: hypothetical protein AAF581_14655 [Planctomycetota bacterium]
MDELQAQVVKLQRRNARLLAILRLVVVLLKVSGFTLHRRRVPDTSKKRLILRAWCPFIHPNKNSGAWPLMSVFAPVVTLRN